MAHPLGADPPADQSSSTQSSAAQSSAARPSAVDPGSTRSEEERLAADTLAQPGMSFRGGFGTLGREAYEIGRRYRHSGVLLSSRDVRIATDNFADDDIVVIFGQESRDVAAQSEFPEEAETVFAPDLSFTVVAQVQIDNRRSARLGSELVDAATDRRENQQIDHRLDDQPFLTVVVVHGERPDYETNVDDAVQRAGQAIAGARQLGEAVLPRPGRYRGPIGVGADGRPDLAEDD